MTPLAREGGECLERWLANPPHSLKMNCNGLTSIHCTFGSMTGFCKDLRQMQLITTYFEDDIGNI